MRRTDILTGGATTTYGADAISGVVNFVTKRDFEGAEITLSEQITEEGDGETQRADVTLGANFDDGRGNAVFSLGYQTTDAVFQGDRSFSEFNVNSFNGNPGGSSNAVPANIVYNSPIDSDLNFAGQINNAGTDITDTFNPTPFNFNPFNIFQTPFERYNMFGSANYEITDKIEAYTQGTFSKQSVSTIIAPGGSFFNTYDLNLNNPFIPEAIAIRYCDGEGLSDAQCTAARTTPFGATLADGSANPDYQQVRTQVRRRSVEAGTRDSEFTTTLFNFVAGFRGDITDNISYDISGTYGESERIQRQTGFARFERLQQSLLSLPDGSCSDPSGGCVPINLFGQEGSITDESIDYVFGLSQQVITTADITTLNATLSGNLGFGLTSTPIGFAAGGEYRDFGSTRLSDEASQTPGAVVGGGGAAPDINGSYDVYDVFAELYIPLLEDRPFAESLSLDLGGRISDYSTAGTEYTYKIGGAWALQEGLGTTIRGNYQRSSRAPNIGELFAPVVTGLDNLQTDPCQLDLPVGNANLTAVCIAQGAPAGTIGSIQPPAAGQINVTGGGNVNLGVETANTYTIGVVWEPEFIDNFSLTVDYFDIDVSDAVSAPAVGDVISGCFDNLSAASATDPACTQQIFRSPFTGGLDGSPDEVRGLITAASNLGSISTNGVDLSARYSRELNNDFALAASFDGTWVNENTFQSAPGNLVRDCVGFFSVNCGSPQSEFAFTQRTTVDYKDFLTFSLRWRYLSGLEQEPDDILNGNGPAFQGTTDLFGDVDFQSIPDEHYFDLTAQWLMTDFATLTLGANNIFDNQPGIVGSNIGSTAFNSGNVYPSSYDTLGRRYSASVKFKF